MQVSLFVVTWLDAASIDDWTDASEVRPECSLIVSSGILVGETADTLTLAANFDSSGNAYSCIMNIPKSCIAEAHQLVPA
jgi:hypothetical protein